ncbi:hypothetical protein SAMN07250955_11139 [Arboricoccus pini]|uniref:Uncharacterized protein n=1 Tax=Arboricoccus pini TaxID=1963835 RepID=A0A212RN52_9PROT|nr:hypothetical protein [Arboricoccus pini]SNB73951.1 hypothetical protein SAMN07250955_11139 [Arboricoccus pini]
MAKLKPLDLGAFDAEDETPPAVAPSPARRRRAGEGPSRRVGTALEELATQSPRLVSDELSRIRREERVMMSFNNMPVTIRNRFEEEAARRGWGKKELFIEMMRAFGIDVPPYRELDGRRQY